MNLFLYLGEQVASLEVEDLGLVLEVGGSAVAPGSLGLFARLAPGVHSSIMHLVIHRCSLCEVAILSI